MKTDAIPKQMQPPSMHVSAHYIAAVEHWLVVVLANLHSVRFQVISDSQGYTECTKEVGVPNDASQPL